MTIDADTLIALATFLPGNLSTDLVLIFAYRFMLDVRGRRLIWLVALIAFLECLCVTVRLVDPSNPSRMLFSTLAYAVVPFVLSPKPVATKTYLVISIMFVLFACEILCVIPFTLCGVEPFSTQAIIENYPMYLFEITLHAALFSALLFATDLAFKRLQKNRLNGTYFVFMLFLLCQLTALSFVMYVTFYLAGFTLVPSVAAICLVAAMSAADCALFLSIKNTEESYRQEHLRILREEELRADLEANEQSLRYLRDIAAFRHDFRNQKDVIAELARAGEFDRACEQVAQLEAGLEDVR